MSNSHLLTFSNYFTQIQSHSVSDRMSVIEKLTADASEKIITQIDNSSIHFPQQMGLQVALLSKKPQERETSPTKSEILKELSEEKKTMIKRVQQLQQQEHTLKSQAYSSRIKNLKSVLTENDRQELKRLFRVGRQKERKFKKAEQKLFQLVLQKSDEEIKSENASIEKRKKENKEIALKNIKSLQMTKEKRQKNHILSQKVIKSIKQKKYLHELNEEKDYLKEYEQKREYQERLEQFKMKQKFEMTEIEEHQRKYKQMMEQHRNKTENKVISKATSNPNLSTNYFSIITRHRMEQEKAEQKERYLKAKESKQKMIEYQKEIRSTFKPKTSEKSKFAIPQNTISAQALSYREQFNRGNEYLRKAKELGDLEKQKQRREKRIQSMTTQSKKNSYHDYLKEGKQRRNGTTEQEFKNLIQNKESVSDFQNANKALLLAEKIEAQSKKRKDTTMMISIKHKMEILQALQN